MITSRAFFDDRTYMSGQVYAFRDLPKEVKKDLRMQKDGLELAFGKGPGALRYKFLIVPPERLVACLERAFGKDLFQKRIQEEDIVELARLIKYHGLYSPPVEDEGYHRAFALASLGWPMPYFEVEGTPLYPLPAICRSDEAGIP